jgi:hypothetical protein
MVVALKELTLRGDIRTTVEYLVNLMESEDFVANNIDTAWLDKVGCLSSVLSLACRLVCLLVCLLAFGLSLSLS